MEEGTEGERVFMCGGCDPERIAAMADAVRRAVPDAEIVVVECLNACGNPVSVAMRAPGRAAYLFGGTDPEAQATEIAAFVALWRAGPAGEIADARSCGALRGMLRGRIPA